MTAITGVDTNSVYTPVPFLQKTEYTLTPAAAAGLPKITSTGRGDGGHSAYAYTFVYVRTCGGRK